jgi:hypothetical protein
MVAGGSIGGGVGSALSNIVKGIENPYIRGGVMSIAGMPGMFHLEMMAEEAEKERAAQFPDSEPEIGRFDPSRDQQTVGQAFLEGSEDAFLGELLGLGFIGGAAGIKAGANHFSGPATLTDIRRIADEHGLRGDIPAFEQNTSAFTGMLSQNIPRLTSAGRRGLIPMYRRSLAAINDLRDKAIDKFGKTLPSSDPLADTKFGEFVQEQIQASKQAASQPLSERTTEVIADMAENGYTVNVGELIANTQKPGWDVVREHSLGELNKVIEKHGFNIPMTEAEGLIKLYGAPGELMPDFTKGLNSQIVGDLTSAIEKELSALGRTDMLTVRKELKDGWAMLYDTFDNAEIKAIVRNDRHNMVAKQIFQEGGAKDKGRDEITLAFKNAINDLPPEKSEALWNNVRQTAIKDVLETGGSDGLVDWWGKLGKFQKSVIATDTDPEHFKQLDDVVKLIDNVQPEKMIERYSGTQQDLVERGAVNAILSAALRFGPAMVGMGGAGAGGFALGGPTGAAIGTAIGGGAGAIFGFYSPKIVAKLASSKRGATILSSTLSEIGEKAANKTLSAKDIVVMGTRLTQAYDRMETNESKFIKSPPEIAYEGAL